MKSSTNRHDFIDYLLLFLVVIASGNPAVALFGAYAYIFIFIILFFIFFKRNLKFDKFFILFFIFLCIITLLQALVFNFISVITTLGLFTRVLLAYLIIKILGSSFIEKYINLMSIIAAVSLVVYGLSNINSSMLIPFSVQASSSRFCFLGLFTFLSFDIHRNCGPFWEPGAYVAYLLIAFAFNLFTNKTLWERKNVILLITIISTLSTTGYLALFTLLYFYFYQQIKNAIFKLTVIPILLLGTYYAYTQLDFLGKKIEEQLEMAEKTSIQESKNSQRFLNLIRDYYDFQGHEIIGRGTNNKTRYSFDPEHQIRTVGFSDILVKFGLPFFILIFYFLYKSICTYILYVNGRYIKMHCMGIFLMVFVTLASEVFFNYPFYWSLLFLQFVYNSENGNET